MDTMSYVAAYRLRLIAFIGISLYASVFDELIAILLYLTALVIWHMRLVEERHENRDTH